MKFSLGQSTPMTQDLESEWIDVSNAEVFALHAIVSNPSSPVGSLKLQVSCEPYEPQNPLDLTGSTKSVSGAANEMWDVGPSAVKWVRVVYTFVSGSADLVAYFNTKEEK